MNRKLSVFLLVYLFLQMLGCVSVNVGGKKAKKASLIQLEKPSPHFTEIKKEHADRYWRSDLTGNSISFLSECDTPGDPSLNQVLDGLKQGLIDSELVKREELTYNQRAAVKAEIKGFVDGVESIVETLIFKKNNCLYLITYISVPETFETERAIFNQFLQGFRAP